MNIWWTPYLNCFTLYGEDLEVDVDKTKRLFVSHETMQNEVLL